MTKTSPMQRQAMSLLVVHVTPGVFLQTMFILHTWQKNNSWLCNFHLKKTYNISKMRVMVLRWSNSDVTYEGAKPSACVKTYFGDIVVLSDFNKHFRVKFYMNNEGDMSEKHFWCDLRPWGIVVQLRHVPPTMWYSHAMHTRYVCADRVNCCHVWTIGMP